MDFIASAVEAAFRIDVLTGTALGILGKYVYDFYWKYRAAEPGKKPKFDTRGFLWTGVVSLFFSILVYGTVLQAVAQIQDPAVAFSVAVQNGFLWESLFTEPQKASGSSGQALSQVSAQP